MTASPNSFGDKPRVVKFTKAFGAFSTAGLTISLNLFNLDKGQMIEKAVIRHTTAFAGAAITEVYASLGFAGATEDLVPEHDVLQAIGDTVFASSGALDSIKDFVNQTAVKLSLRSVGANLNVLSAGALEVHVWLTEAGT